ncbi:hypothetical protein ACFST9_10005 [Hymenobacter monticola]|uniref:Magnesium citrate secondary transporter n=1 Tax=Hymenobacter monticola TaxID=1705399 RepID=A0ABY4B8G9_9BACT|nr:hypothetical protein [Hymenobacter monticola]UOE35466.1 hypothetical protein MTP16_07400 [Hymenobacter monticola]
MKRWPEFTRPLFVGALLLYGLRQANRHWLQGPLPPLLTSYLSDLAAMPVMLTLAVAAYRRMVARSQAFVLPDAWLGWSWVAVSMWFEGILPLFDAQAVADPLDALAYAAGTLAFRRWLNRPA